MNRYNLRALVIVLAVSLIQASSAWAAKPSYTVKGRLVGGTGRSVFLLSKDGSSKSVTLSSSGKFSFKKLSASKIRGASLQIADENGRYVGPVILAKKGSKVSTTFKARGSNVIDLGSITLFESFAKVRKRPEASVYNRANVSADSTGKPIGAGESGLVLQSSPIAQRVAATAEDAPAPGSDSDADGLPDSFDADDDGDLILDGSDSDSAGLDVPYTGLNFDFRRTLNAHVRDGLSDTAIDEAVASENAFSLTFFFSLPENSNIDGGYIVCDDGLTYCRPNSPLAYYGGVSESSSDFRNRPWSELLTTAGFPRMENLNLSFGRAIAASIQPRVGRSQFQPGDVYRAVLTSGGREVSSRTLTLAPYFVSIPALKSYDAGFGEVAVDYSSVDVESGSIPGVSPGDPIVLSGTGAMTFTFWRPQRQAIRSDESGYYDWGSLHYGAIVSEAQATCAGYYTNVSSDLVADDSPFGDGDSPFANQGANMYPYTDAQGDRAVNAGNLLTFTVNLKDCLSRAGMSPGVHSVTLSAAGESVTGGQITAAQGLYVQVP